VRWTLVLDPAGRPGWQNMALDQALLDLADAEGRGFLRLYRWTPHCLSFGRNEPALRRYDREAIEHQGLDAVRRPTGGRAVWHADELTYSVAAPCTTFGTPAASYQRIHELLAAAVRTLGAPAWIATAPARTAALDAGACFASPAGGEVMVGDRKVVGSAQLRQGTALLQHGSLLLGGSQAVVTALTRGQPPADQSATLGDLLARPVRFAEAADAVIRQTDAWGAAWDLTGEVPPDAAAAAERHGARFRSPDWTWRR
jgi:lipoyl(octanoyl) transferase